MIRFLVKAPASPIPFNNPEGGGQMAQDVGSNA
jgi:hypothetical protein